MGILVPFDAPNDVGRQYAAEEVVKGSLTGARLSPTGANQPKRTNAILHVTC